MIDWQKFNKTPPVLIGMKKKDAISYLNSNNFLFGIASEDGKTNILPMIVMITLNVENGVVVGTGLDSKRWGKW